MQQNSYFQLIFFFSPPLCELAELIMTTSEQQINNWLPPKTSSGDKWKSRASSMHVGILHYST